MAITLKSDYRKTLGLPGYSSHSFSASVEIELSTADDIPAEIHRLYQTLQQNVDHQIQDPGYVPESTYGMDTTQSSTPTTQQQPASSPPANRRSAPQSHYGGQQNRSNGARQKSYGGRQTNNSQQQAWKCSEKQRSLIDKLIRESEFTKQSVDAVAQDRFGKGVPALNKLEASGLIDMMINQPDIFTFNSGLQS